MGFNWQQTIIHNPANPTRSTLKPNSPGPLILSGNVAYLGMTLLPLNPLGRCLSSVLWTGCSLTAGPSPAYYDPPSGGYIYMNNDPYPNPYPFLIPSQLIYAGSRTCNVAPLCPIFPYAESDDGTTLSMVDAPADSNLSGETPTTTPFRNFEAFRRLSSVCLLKLFQEVRAAGQAAHFTALLFTPGTGIQLLTATLAKGESR